MHYCNLCAGWDQICVKRSVGLIITVDRNRRTREVFYARDVTGFIQALTTTKVVNALCHFYKKDASHTLWKGQTIKMINVYIPKLFISQRSGVRYFY